MKNAFLYHRVVQEGILIPQYKMKKVFDKKMSVSFNKSMELGVDLKTVLQKDKRMQPGKPYRGVLVCESDAVVEEFLCRDAQYKFTEIISAKVVKHNPRVFDGEYVSITLRDDGTPRPNFKLKRLLRESDVNDFVFGVCNELRQALEGLVEK